MEEPVEGLALDESLQAALVETQRTEDVGQGSYYFPGWRYLVEEKRLSYNLNGFRDLATLCLLIAIFVVACNAIEK